MTEAQKIGELPAVMAHPGHGFVNPGGLTIRQAYKIAAIPVAEKELSEVSVDYCARLLNKKRDDYNAAEDFPRCIAVEAAKIADAMLAEDSAHEAAMSGKGEA